MALLPRVWLIVGRSSGMSTIKVHEWCLVCYGWLDVCLRSNFHAFLPFQLCSWLICLDHVVGYCVGYLICGIGGLDYSLSS